MKTILVGCGISLERIRTLFCNDREYTLDTELPKIERELSFSLPEIIFKHQDGRYKSKGQIKKNRRDFNIMLDEYRYYEFSTGKPPLDYVIVTGRKEETEKTIWRDNAVMWYGVHLAVERAIDSIDVFFGKRLSVWFYWKIRYKYRQFVLRCEFDGFWETLRRWRYWLK